MGFRKDRCCCLTKEGRRCRQKTVWLEGEERASTCRTHLYPKGDLTLYTMYQYYDHFILLSYESQCLYLAHANETLSLAFLKAIMEQDIQYFDALPKKVKERVLTCAQNGHQYEGDHVMWNLLKEGRRLPLDLSLVETVREWMSQLCGTSRVVIKRQKLLEPFWDDMHTKVRKDETIEVGPEHPAPEMYA